MALVRPRPRQRRGRALFLPPSAGELPRLLPSPAVAARCSASRSRGSRTCRGRASARVIAVSHVSFLDAPILLSLMDGAAAVRDRPRRGRRWWIRFFLKLCGVAPARPVAAADGAALIKQARAGRPLAIFPEGRIAVTGPLMSDLRRRRADDREERGARSRRCGSSERSAPIFSRLDAAHVGRRLFPKVTVTILPPRPARDAGRVCAAGRAGAPPRPRFTT